MEKVLIDTFVHSNFFSNNIPPPLFPPSLQTFHFIYTASFFSEYIFILFFSSLHDEFPIKRCVLVHAYDCVPCHRPSNEKGDGKIVTSFEVSLYIYYVRVCNFIYIWPRHGPSLIQNLHSISIFLHLLVLHRSSIVLVFDVYFFFLSFYFSMKHWYSGLCAVYRFYLCIYIF